MKTAKTSKRALLCSVLSIALCLSMLIGTTFAWFTDTASTAVNKIQAGNLDIALEMKEGNNWVTAEGKTLNFVKAEGHENEATLWEPGATYKLPELRVVNNGNLALKYKIVISGAKDMTVDDKDDLKLLDVIDWTYTVNGETYTLGTDKKLGVAATTDTGATGYDTLTIKGQMRTTAGNEYQGMAVEGIAITVYATQDTVEYDSINNTYDAKAAYPVADATELKTALDAGGAVSVKEDIKTDNIGDTAADRVIISQPTTLNLEAKIVTPNDMGNNSVNFTALIVDADTTINATEKGGIDTGVNGGYGINVRNGANLTINGGSYYGGGTAVQVQKGTLTINGGKFACEPFGDPYGYNFLLNCIDSAYKNGTAKIIVKGGTFVNFNPADCSAEGAHTNFVGEGYTVVSEAHGSDTWYTVVKAN